ncbi:enoyl-CoA hydratase/isomerase family protein [Oceanicola sp. 502str15]|uniref:enoyl-CoA hydratase/isomerase family protein n=1 Tax=Oceanicola sp. 502str15 TaxID=2696061 RepID=UPI002095C91A|nr:enoyl-CoA hydratase/isomerase family protein [Oceanicola sp. 502str15]MCO6385335.1 enoyl-CoA hydratase/isomerase family protein [Oceanicola sp. 502str15]
MYDFKTISVTTTNGVGQILLDRPPVNAMNRVMRDELVTAFATLGGDTAVRAIVLSGNGKMFCAGADLKDRPDTSHPGAYTDHNLSVRTCFNSAIECPKPIIAALNGAAIGAGLVLATCCDIIVAQEGAWVSMPEVEVGLAGGPRHMMRHFHQSDARLMMYTARRISAPDLYRMNVISACVSKDELSDYAAGLASEIASKSPSAVRAAKESFILGEDLPLNEAYRHEQTLTEALSAGPDFAEAQAAFREKRPPVFGND